MVAALVAWAAPAVAQSTGMIKGKIVDGNNQVVEGAKVIIESKESGSRKFEVKTNKKGEFIQIGLPPGPWTVTATKEGVGTADQDVRVSIGETAQVDLTLAVRAPTVTKEEAAKAAAFKKIFDEGVAASQAGNPDVAIARFTEALTSDPSCYACQYNIGLAHLNKQQLDKAEAAFLAAAKLNDKAAEPYNQLALIYNTQKNFEKASAMAAEASKRAPAGGGATGGGAETLYNQGVVYWNSQKFAEAKAQFDAAIKANPSYAEAYYRAAMADLNLGKVDDAIAAFEGYLKVAPNGPYAKEVKDALAAFKK